MAKLSGPLFSLDAAGQLGKTLVYSKWKGRNYSRKYVVPSNPKSAGQLGIRAMFGMLAAAWAALSANAKATWEEIANSKSYSTFNAFMEKNMERWGGFMAPTHAWPAAETVSATTVATLVTTGGENHVAVSGTLTSGTDHWGVLIFRSDAEIVTPTYANVVAVLPTDGGTTFSWVDSGLSNGTYHYRAAAITNDGNMGVVKADQTATVT